MDERDGHAVDSPRASSPSSHARERRRGKQSGERESGKEVPRKSPFEPSPLDESNIVGKVAL